MVVVGHCESLAELGTELSLSGHAALAELDNKTLLSGRAAGLLNHGISPLSKSAQNAPESFLVVIRQEIRAVRAGTIVAYSRRLMQLAARCFCLTYTTIQKNRNWGVALCTNFFLFFVHYYNS